MVITEDILSQQLALLKEKYPSFEVVQADDRSVQLHGSLHINRVYNGFVLNKKYNLDIHIPLNSERLPYVVDCDGVISSKYHHKYINGSLCLETDLSIKMRFKNGFDLVAWIYEFVEPYFVSYEYFMRYGEFPYGERAHGCLGSLQACQDLLQTSDEAAAYSLLKFIVERSPYRGHALCPCGSSKRLRNCHGPVIMAIYQDEPSIEILHDEMIRINAELRSYDKKRRNQYTAK